MVTYITINIILKNLIHTKFVLGLNKARQLGCEH